LSKVVNTYLDNKSAGSKVRKTRIRNTKAEKSATPPWFAFGLIVLVFFMVCLAINLRAFSEMKVEMNQNEALQTEINELTSENMLLLKEVDGIKTDSKTIEREARKIGMSRPNEKILVPVD
jgi:cell division protein FtsB